MPLQNRVTPFGEIVAVSARGLFTGNRGIIHEPATKTLLNRRWSSKAWLVCALEHKGVRRAVMAARSWTELFFLDEATALAAGHRPCFACRRDAANGFRQAWAKGNGIAAPQSSDIDAALHRERLDNRHKRLQPLSSRIKNLPDGAIVAVGGEAFLVLAGATLRWDFSGYLPADPPGGAAHLLTPPSTLRALAAGYRPALHQSAWGLAPKPRRATIRR